MTWMWNDSFVVKDVMSVMRKSTVVGSVFPCAFQTQLFKELVDIALDCPEKPKDFDFKIEEPERLYDRICLTSGGADSTIAWLMADKPQGLYIDIGQPYAQKERKALHMMGIEYHYVDMRGTHLSDKTWKHIIPARNLLFLSIAAELLKNNGDVWFAMVEGEGELSGRGDKSLAFIRRFEEWYTATTDRHIYITDMCERTKPGWLRWVQDYHGVEMLQQIRKHTVTCFSPEDGECGRCQACLRKYLSYVSIGMFIDEDFNVHPIEGCQEFIEKYKFSMNHALEIKDFSHYSARRCEEDLAAIHTAERRLLLK